MKEHLVGYSNLPPDNLDHMHVNAYIYIDSHTGTHMYKHLKKEATIKSKTFFFCWGGDKLPLRVKNFANVKVLFSHYIWVFWVFSYMY